MHPTSSRAARALAIFATCAGLAAATPAADATPRATKSKAARTTPKPDLITKGLSVDFADESLTVDARIANTGSRRARRSDATIAISTDRTLGDEDTFLDDVAVPRVQPHAERSISADVEIPDDLPEGALFLLVCADGNEAVAERHDDNNCASQELISSDDEQADPGDDSGDDDSSSVDPEETADFPVTIDQ